MTSRRIAARRLVLLQALLVVGGSGCEHQGKVVEWPVPPATGQVALFGRRVEALPVENRFGNLPGGWMSPSEELALTARAVEGALEVGVQAVDPYGRLILRLVLTPDGARGEAYGMDDTLPPPFTDLTGVAVLLTDGTRACLEFEVTCCQGFDRLVPFTGQIQMGPLGVELAGRLPSLPPGGQPEPFGEGRNEIVMAEGLAVASGRVDGEERRQGTWTLLDPAGRKRVESTWRDGLLTGLVTFHDEQGRQTMAQHFERGLQEGTQSWWYPSGVLRRRSEYVHGWEGPWVTFDEQGDEIASGDDFRPLPQGDREEDRSVATIFEPPSTAERLALMAEVSRLHTRAD